MRYDIATTTDHTTAPAQYPFLDQVASLPTNLLPQKNQWILDFLSLSDLPFRQEWWRLITQYLPVCSRAEFTAVVFTLPVKRLSTRHAPRRLPPANRYFQYPLLCHVGILILRAAWR